MIEENSDTTALDIVLHSLGPFSTTEQRLDILRQVTEYWHGPIRPEDGYSEDELKDLPMPYPLRWWYRFAGRREKLLSQQNHFSSPSKLTVDEDGLLIFYVENQGNCIWGVEAGEDDPPLYSSTDFVKHRWNAEKMPLSEFLIGTAIFESIASAEFGASAAWIELPTLAKIERTISSLPLSPWHWPTFPGRFFAKGGAFMFACPDDRQDGIKSVSVWIASKTAVPLAFLKEIVSEEWDHVAI